MIRPPPNRPRQNRMVQGSNGNSRVKNGAVLQATAAAITSAMPTRRSEGASGMLEKSCRKILAGAGWG